MGSLSPWPAARAALGWLVGWGWSLDLGEIMWRNQQLLGLATGMLDSSRDCTAQCDVGNSCDILCGFFLRPQLRESRDDAAMSASLK